MPVDEIKPGMKGYGLSVFKGTKVDTFNVEIIDVMKKELPKGDVILAKISGKVVDTAGVIAGMSGSPIYLYDETKPDNRQPKLIGALAYRYAIFAKEPFAGITPIEEMLNPPSLGYVPSTSKFCYLKIPIICPGLDDQLLQELKKELPCFDFLRVQEGGGVVDDSIIPYPGSSLGVLLVEGDLTWYGMGTCTYTEGDKIWGFGHPMAALGETELPMTAGYIYSVIPSSFDSYKMAAPTKVIGTIRNDNSRGISGIIGKTPDLITLNLLIKEEKFHYRIIKEKFFLPLLFNGLTLYSIYSGIKGTGDITAEISLEVRGTRDFYFKNLCTGAPQDIAKSISEVFTLIQANPFQRIDIKEISVNLTASDTIKIAKIDEIRTDKKEVKPGDTLNLLICLLTYQGGRAKKHIPIEIPAWVKQGDLVVEVADGKSVRNQTKSHLTTIDGLIRWLSTSPQDNEIVITLTQKGESGWIADEEFHSLPPSIAGFIKGEGKGESKVFEKKIPTEWVVVQKKSLKLEVK